MSKQLLIQKAKKIRLLLSDVDGVLTDNGVYYSAEGEQLKRFSIRDGMGVERLRNECSIETGFITGEQSGSVVKRAEKLQVKELHLGIKNKASLFLKICKEKNMDPAAIAYIGDDVNDIEIMKVAGLSACPLDAMDMVRNIAGYVCDTKGGEGAFREFAEFIISCQKEETLDSFSKKATIKPTHL